MQQSEKTFAKRLDPISGSAIRELLKLTAKPGIISFAGGNPGDVTLPDDIISELCVKTLAQNGKKILQYGPTEGYAPLVELLTAYIKDEFSAEVSKQEILPVTGSSQAMDLICKAYINPGDTILVENPTFLGNLQCMRIYEANLVPVESDENGLIPELLEVAIIKHKPRALYTIPTFQNPTGITLSLERRKQIAAMAAKYQMLVIEDDPYRSLRYSGDVLPSIKAFDEDGWVALIGSFSKVISPGLRVGFLAADPTLVRKCTICKQSTDVHTPTLNQAIVHAYISEGYLEPHIKKACEIYGAQLQTMLNGLEQIDAIKKHTRPDGGLFVFAELSEGTDSKILFEKAVEKGVAFVPGEPFYSQNPRKNTLRLNFSNADVQTIQRGMEILRECAKSL